MSTFKPAHPLFRALRTSGVVTVMIATILLVSTSPSMADGPRDGFANSFSRSDNGVEGWRLGGNYGRGGYDVYRRDRGGWQRVEGSGVKLGGRSDSPWLINSQYEIYKWSGQAWRRVQGSAMDVADGWVIGTDSRSGGYGIYRWNGRQFQRMPGAAVEIGGSYERPWIINSRGERFEWAGNAWQELRSDRRGGRGRDRR